MTEGPRRDLFLHGHISSSELSCCIAVPSLFYEDQSFEICTQSIYEEKIKLDA